MPPSDVTACLRRQRQPARAPRTLEASRAPHIPLPFSRTHRPLPPPLRPAELLGREIGSSRARSARAAAGRPRGARRWGQAAPSAAGVFCPSAAAPRRLAPRGGCGCGAGGGYGPHRWRGGGRLGGARTSWRGRQRHTCGGGCEANFGNPGFRSSNVFVFFFFSPEKKQSMLTTNFALGNFREQPADTTSASAATPRTQQQWCVIRAASAL